MVGSASLPLGNFYPGGLKLTESMFTAAVVWRYLDKPIPAGPVEHTVSVRMNEVFTFFCLLTSDLHSPLTSHHAFPLTEAKLQHFDPPF